MFNLLENQEELMKRTPQVSEDTSSSSRVERSDPENLADASADTRGQDADDRGNHVVIANEVKQSSVPPQDSWIRAYPV